ncbi:MAG: hypothetical protein WD768_18640 [Phycisphaeraceae bacterium]
MPAPKDILAATRYCLKCDYPLDGLMENRCPECGQTFAPDDPLSFRAYSIAKHGKGASFTPWVLLALLLTFGLMTIRPSAGSFDWFYWLIVSLAAVIVVFVAGGIPVQRRQTRITAARGALALDTLIGLHQRGLGTWNICERILRRLNFPGVLELQFAEDLYNFGRLDDAMVIVERAASRCCKARHRFLVIDLRAKIHLALEHYDKVSEAITSLYANEEGKPLAQALEATLAFYMGDLPRALSLAETLADLPATEANVGILKASSVCFLLGRFDDALAWARHQAVDAITLLDEKTRKRLLATRHGRKIVDGIREQYAATVGPSRYYAAMRVHLHRNEIDQAEAAFHAAVKARGDEHMSHPWVQHEHDAHGAILAAARGDEPTARLHAQQMNRTASIVRSPYITYANALDRAIIDFKLGHFSEAVRACGEAFDAAIHPLQRHESTYWLARATTAAGDKDAARDAFKRLLEDHIETRMRDEAKHALQSSEDGSDHT